MRKYEKEFYEAYAACLVNETGDLQYKGYNGGNAISLYFAEKFGINLAEDQRAHDAVCDLLSQSN